LAVFDDLGEVAAFDVFAVFAVFDGGRFAFFAGAELFAVLAAARTTPPGYPPLSAAACSRI
jgi:hypothetical protein